MTTATSPTGPATRSPLVGTVVRMTFASTLLAGLLLSGIALAASGRSAAYGALVGTAMVTVFFGIGTLIVDVVSTVAPKVSLLVALMTYTLQVVLLAVVFTALQASGALDETIDPGWLGWTVIAGTFLWLAAQIRYAVTRRQLIYELPSESSEAGAR